MTELTEVETLQAQIDLLGENLGSASEMTADFSAELRRMRSALADTGRDVKTLETGLSRGLRRALDGVLFGGSSASDALRTVAGTAAQVAYSSATRPVTDALGGAIAQGVGALMQTAVPFARGGVVSGPTYFGLGNGAGLMGEAGPEAIVPLTRGPDGQLGIRSSGGGRPVQVVMNIQTPDANGFRRSQSQIAARMSRVLSAGQRNR